MNTEELEEIVNTISKGDTSFAENLFNKPGGRKHLESLVLAIICALPQLQEDQERLFEAFLKVLDKIESRIKHQRKGQEILEQVYY